MKIRYEHPAYGDHKNKQVLDILSEKTGIYIGRIAKLDPYPVRTPRTDKIEIEFREMWGAPQDGDIAQILPALSSVFAEGVPFGEMDRRLKSALEPLSLRDIAIRVKRLGLTMHECYKLQFRPRPSIEG